MNFFLTYSSVPDVNICISVEVGLIITKMDTQNGEIWALSALLKVKHGTGFKLLLMRDFFISILEMLKNPGHIQ